VNLYSKRTIGWTATLMVFLSVAIVSRFQWQVLVIPGAILVWYGLVAPAPRARIALHKPRRSDLD
jgi:hypothetical protein